MSTDRLPERECELFSAERRREIAIVRFRPNQLLLATNLRLTQVLDDHLREVSECEEVKVILFVGPPGNTALQEYVDLFSRSLQPGVGDLQAKRLCSALDTFITGILRSEKIVVTAVSGQVITDYLGIILACDHRVFADDTVFVNAHLHLGLTPKGGTAYFLSRQLGRSGAYEFLLSRDEIPVQRALDLGLSGDVVPYGELEEHALAVAQRFAECPVDTLRGLKSLVNYPLRMVSGYLDHENRVLDGIMMRRAFPGG